MASKHKVRYAARKVKHYNSVLSNGKMSSAHPSIQERIGRLAQHWDRELQYREAVQARRWEGREKPAY